MNRFFIHKYFKICLMLLLVYPWILEGFHIPEASAALKTINVTDGSIADWNGVTTSFSDQLGDNSGNSYDLSKVYITNDANNLYVRWDISNKNTITSQYFALAITTKRSGLGDSRPTAEARALVVFGSSASAPPSLSVVGSSNTETTNSKAVGQQVATGTHSSSVEAVFPFEMFDGAVTTPISSSTIAPIWAASLSGQSYNSNEQDTVPDTGYLDWSFTDGTYTPKGTGPIPSISASTTTPVVPGNGTVKYKVNVSNVGSTESTLYLSNTNSVTWTLPTGFKYINTATEKPMGYITKADGSTSAVTFTGPSNQATGSLIWSGLSTTQLLAQESLTIEFLATASSIPEKYYSSAQAIVKTSTASKATEMTIDTGDTALVTIPADGTKPMGLSVSGTTSISTTLSWSAVSGASGYNLYQDGVLVNSVPIQGTSRLITGLKSATSYGYQVSAIVSNAETLPSDPLTVLTLPNTPDGLTATGGKGEVQLSWNAVQGADSYKVFKSINSGTDFEEVDSGVTKTAASYKVTGLNAGTTYYFKVKAVNATGETPFSNEASAQTLELPPSPQGLAASGTNQTSTTLTWNSVDGATGYYVYQNGVKITNDPIAATSYEGYQVTGLASGTSYTFSVSAVNSNGESLPSTPISIKTLPAKLDAPTNLKEENTTQTSTTLTWNSVTGATGYNVYLDGQLITSSPITATSYTVNNLTSNTPYVFNVTTLNESIESDLSDPLNVTTLKPIDPLPVATDVQVLGSTTLQSKLTGSYDFSDSEEEGNSIFAWFRATDATGSNQELIQGATKKEYILTDEDLDAYIAFEVTPVTATGQTGTTVTSPFIGPVTDKIPPEISLTLSTTAPTNDTVTVSVYVSETGSGIKLKKWARGDLTVSDFVYKGVELIGSENSFEVSENDIYSVYAEDQQNNATVKTISVTNIDTIAPTISYSLVPSDSSPTVQVPVTVDGTGSNIADLKYAVGVFSASKMKQTGTTFQTSFSITQNQPYTIYARDEAGNEQTLTLYPMGDSNLSKTLDVTDWVECINYVLERSTPREVQRLLSDINRDAELNVTDAVLIANLIMNGYDVYYPAN